MIQQFDSWVYTLKNWKWEHEEMSVPHVHNSIIHNSQKMEAASLSMDG